MNIHAIQYIIDNINIALEFLSFFFIIVAVSIFTMFLILFINKYDNYKKRMISKGKNTKKGPLFYTIFYVILISSSILVLLYRLIKFPNANTEPMLGTIFILVIAGKFVYDNFNFVNEKNPDIFLDYDYLINTLTRWNNLFKQILIMFFYLLVFLFLLFASV